MDDGEHLWQLFQVVYWQGVWTQIIRYDGPPCPYGILGNHCWCTNISDKWSPWDFYFHFIDTYCIYCMASVKNCLMNGELSLSLLLWPMCGLVREPDGSVLVKIHGFPRDGKTQSLHHYCRAPNGQIHWDRPSTQYRLRSQTWSSSWSDMSIPSGGPLPDHSPTGQTVRAKHMPQIYHSSPPTVLCALLFQIHCFVTLHVVMLTDQTEFM